MPHPKVFISYSHDDEAHRKRVLGLAERLRLDGFETMIDQYVEGTPPQGWPRWMLNQIDWADHILLVCTSNYYRRFRGHEAPGVGRGVDWEGAVITNELYDQKSNSTRFIPILFHGEDDSFVPEPLRAWTFYIPTDESSYTKLVERLAGAAGIQPAPLGPPPDLKRRTGTPLVFPDPRPAGAAPVPAAPALADPSARPAPGGTMPVDDPSYIERGADQRAKAAAKRRCETIVIKGPRQFGSSSLLARYLALCRANGKATASVDFSRFEEGIVSNYGRLMTTLASQLVHRLHLAIPITEFGTQESFLQFLETKLLPAVKGVVVLAFDETDRAMRQAYAGDFFSMVRMWHNDRADPESQWNKVGLALSSSSEPKLFIRDPMRSPFNVGDRLALDPFTAPEAAELNRRYGSPLSTEECTELHRLLGGHPFLTQEAYYRLFGPERIPFDQLRREAAQDDGPFGEHLRAMLANVQAVDGLLDALKLAIKRGTVDRKIDFYRLEGAGLLRRENGRAMPTNQIYADFFLNVA